METGATGTHPASRAGSENTTGIANPPLIDGDTITVDSEDLVLIRGQVSLFNLLIIIVL